MPSSSSDSESDSGDHAPRRAKKPSPEVEKKSGRRSPPRDARCAGRRRTTSRAGRRPPAARTRSRATTGRRSVSPRGCRARRAPARRPCAPCAGATARGIAHQRGRSSTTASRRPPQSAPSGWWAAGALQVRAVSPPPRLSQRCSPQSSRDWHSLFPPLLRRAASPYSCACGFLSTLQNRFKASRRVGRSCGLDRLVFYVVDPSPTWAREACAIEQCSRSTICT